MNRNLVRRLAIGAFAVAGGTACSSAPDGGGEPRSTTAALTSTSNPLHPDVQETENWTAPVNVGWLSATLTVPPSPPFDGQYVAYHIDLEHDSAQRALTVELMYVGQDFWSADVAWIEGGSPPVYHSSGHPLTTVASGDVLHMTIEGLSGPANCQSSGACKWVMTVQDATQGYSTSVSTYLDVPFRWIWGGAMDTSNITSCGELPSSVVRFQNIEIKEWGTGTVLKPSTWTPSYDSGICGIEPSGPSASEVDFSP